MRIGIIGAGEIGATLARLFVGVGHEVVLANSRGPESLAGLVAALGEAATAGTLEGSTTRSARRRRRNCCASWTSRRRRSGRPGAGFTTALSAALAGGQLEGSQCPQRRQRGVELQRLRFIRRAGRVEVTPLAHKLGAAGGDVRAGLGRRWGAQRDGHGQHWLPTRTACGTPGVSGCCAAPARLSNEAAMTKDPSPPGFTGPNTPIVIWARTDVKQAGPHMVRKLVT